MDGKYSGIKIIAGNSNMALAQEIAEYLEVQLCNAEVVSFSDGESASTFLNRFVVQMFL
jgi:Phosphoribosylpyrophosphate synthetase